MSSFHILNWHNFISFKTFEYTCTLNYRAFYLFFIIIFIPKLSESKFIPSSVLLPNKTLEIMTVKIGIEALTVWA